MKIKLIYSLLLYILTVLFFLYVSLLSGFFTEEIVVTLNSEELNNVTVFKKGLKTGLEQLEKKNGKYYLEAGLSTGIILETKKKPTEVQIVIGESTYQIYNFVELSSSKYMLSIEKSKRPFIFNKNIFLLNMINYNYNLFLFSLIAVSALFWLFSYFTLLNPIERKDLYVKYGIVLFTLSCILSNILQNSAQDYILAFYLFILILISLMGAYVNGIER